MAKAKCYIADYNDGSLKWRHYKDHDTTLERVVKAFEVLPHEDKDNMYTYKFELFNDSGEYVGDVYTLNKFLFV